MRVIQYFFFVFVTCFVCFVAFVIQRKKRKSKNVNHGLAVNASRGIDFIDSKLTEISSFPFSNSIASGTRGRESIFTVEYPRRLFCASLGKSLHPIVLEYATRV